MLPTAAVCKLCHLLPRTLAEWVSQGIISPIIRGGKGRGNTHQFSLMQSVGIVVGAEIHRSERGCLPGYAGAVVVAFELVSERWLTGQFRTGKRYLVAINSDKPVLTVAGVHDGIDVEVAYKAVKEASAEQDE